MLVASLKIIILLVLLLVCVIWRDFSCLVVQNLCLKATQACKGQRVFGAPRIGVAEDKVAQYAGLHYYTDKELQVNIYILINAFSRYDCVFS